MNHIKLIIFIAMAMQTLHVHGQSNLLENGGFEADFNNQHYPRLDSNLYSNSPFPWLDYNPGDDERWYIDSVWVPPNINVPNPGFQNGYYSNQFNNIGAPWESGSNKLVQIAHGGRSYIGFNTKSDLFTREGIQTKTQNNCKFNSGEYTASVWWSRAYPVGNTKFWLYLSNQSSTRRKKIGVYKVFENTFNPGEWNLFTTDFELKLNKSLQMGNHWFSISGSTVVQSQYANYMYFDDVSLYRQCDLDSACFNPTGQICPVFATPGPPGPPMVIKNIENADEIHVIIYNQLAQRMIDTTFYNPNGLPDFYFQPAILSGNVASGNYPYDVTLSNKCGAVQYEGQFQVQAGIYDTLGPWIDSTAHWSEVPKECCLHTLTLSDMEITGDVSYIVKDTIWVTNGVTAASGSDILIQAGQVVELDSVEFDGTNTVVEILEAPCQGCRLLPPSSGGTAPNMAEVGTHAILTGSHQEIPIIAGEAIFNDTRVKQETNSTIETETDYTTDLWAYPNPFSSILNLEVELSQAGPVSLTVYDIQMRPVVKVAMEETLPEGIHPFKIDLGNEPRGIYFVQLVSRGQTITEKVVKQ